MVGRVGGCRIGKESEWDLGVKDVKDVGICREMGSGIGWLVGWGFDRN